MRIQSVGSFFSSTKGDPVPFLTEDVCGEELVFEAADAEASCFFPAPAGEAEEEEESEEEEEDDDDDDDETEEPVLPELCKLLSSAADAASGRDELSRT
ncbi:MAG: hypothetical protein WHS88_06095 [Anaerohalosphaeraceae bacterium]